MKHKCIFRAIACLGLAAIAQTAEPPTPAEIAAAIQINTAVIHTSHGDIRVKLLPGIAPCTVANFAKLARSGFYDRLAFHRVVPGFVAQGGDPNTREGIPPEQAGPVGNGGPGYTIPAELPPQSPERHTPGTLAMADRGLNTAGSQFYITLADTPHLDGRYTIFGRVETDNDMKVALSIAAGDRFSVEIPATGTPTR